MQPMQAFSEVDDWTCLTDQDFMSHLLHNIHLGHSASSSSSLAWSWSSSSANDHTSFFYPLNNSSSANAFPQTHFYDKPVTFPNVTDHHFHDPYQMTPHNPVLCSGGFPSAEPDEVIQGDDYLNHETEEETIVNCSSSNMRKRSRSAENVKEMKRNDKLQKNKSSLDLLSACSSEENSIESQKNGEGLSLSSKKPPRASGKTRATRGSATDPQSVYARKRRERINQRLKTLQNLIPNGTKVDISTMLEEAVHYVKFLQHQIKLLSSDDHWMYAPIAYNGSNVGLDLNFNALT